MDWTDAYKHIKFRVEDLLFPVCRVCWEDLCLGQFETAGWHQYDHDQHPKGSAGLIGW